MRDLEQQRATSGDLDSEFYCGMFVTLAITGAVAGTVLTGGVGLLWAGALVAAAAGGAACAQAAAD